MTDKIKKRVFCGILIINYIAILIYNFLTPPMSDDLYWHPGERMPLSEIFHEAWLYYNNWLGRVEANIFNRIMDSYPKPVFNVISSFFFIVLIFVLYKCLAGEEEYDCRSLALISLYIWIWGIDFSQTMLWVSGACNYLWTLTIEFGFLAYYRHILRGKDKATKEGRGPDIPGTVGLLLWGILAGAGNESSSGAILLLVCYFTVTYCLERSDNTKKISTRVRQTIRPYQIASILGLIIGLAIMVLAPGNKVRGAVSGSEESQTGLLMYLGRFIKLNGIIFEHMSILIVVIVILLVYMHKVKGKSVKDLADIYAYIAVAVISIYVVILTTTPMPRAFLGSSFILLIAGMQLIRYLDKQDCILDTLITSAVILMTLFMMHSYVKNAANLVRIMRELDIRQEYVDEQKAEGKESLVLPMLRPEWDNRYTYIYYNNDVNEEPGSFGNEIYSVYYDLKEVTGVPWEEWEATRQE